MEEAFTVEDVKQQPAAEGAPANSNPTPDLSIAIARAVEKQPGEHVRVRRVGPRTYRCNWLTPDQRHTGGDLKSMITYRTRDSKFLRVTREGGQLVMEDLTISPVNY